MDAFRFLAHGEGPATITMVMMVMMVGAIAIKGGGPQSTTGRASAGRATRKRIMVASRSDVARPGMEPRRAVDAPQKGTDAEATGDTERTTLSSQPRRPR
jgi:hypothetical protein